MFYFNVVYFEINENLVKLRLECGRIVLYNREDLQIFEISGLFYFIFIERENKAVIRKNKVLLQKR